MAEELKPSTRLYAILARKAPQAVIFRRGPSKEVLLTLWHTNTDEFVPGQWFKGRIYERRCDLSPDGKFLIYFAAKFKEPYAWTAISKPPFLTALALWHKQDTWGGGGLFAGNNEILLNHRPEEMTLAEGFHLPESMKVQPCGEYSGRGEDSPILETRMDRDGWQFVQQGNSVEHGIGAPLWIEYNPPLVWKKLNQRYPKYELFENLIGIHDRDGPFLVIEYAIREDERETKSLGRTDWADWSHSGDLLYAKEGKILRLGFAGDRLQPLSDARVLFDFTECKFEANESPEEAKVWS